MSRQTDLGRFYGLLEQIETKVGRFRYLRDCTGRDGWPLRGIYFFFEEGEYRERSRKLRVVRVGTHALTDSSQTKLWSRLKTHKGQMDSTGNHRGSIFRKRIGQALLNKAAVDNTHRLCPTWGEGTSAPAAIRSAESALEKEVSFEIGRMPFLWLCVDDAHGKASSRAYLEKNCIALLSNFERSGVDLPSCEWLGRFSEQETIRNSGLWNSNCVKENYDASFLDVLSTFVEGQSRSAPLGH